MDYRKATTYPTPNHGKVIVPELLVCHTTEGGSKEWLDGLFRGAYDRGDSVNVSVHWCVYKDGTIIEYAPWRKGEAVACWQAGQSMWHDRGSLNYWSLGFEIQHLAGEKYPEVQIQAICDLVALVHDEYPDMELVTHAQVAWPRGRKTDPTPPWQTDVFPRVLAAWNATAEEDMAQEDTDKLISSAQAQSYRSSITNALLVQDYTAAERLNKAFYERWPEGETGLPEGWAAPKA
jgi:N-acetyl-anhydromuramyl-L-alanine amidase AmpD